MNKRTDQLSITVKVNCSESNLIARACPDPYCWNSLISRPHGNEATAGSKVSTKELW